jgi:hypothetical protein
MKLLRERAGITLLLVAILALPACGALRERSVCRQYEDFQAVVAEVRELDPTTATAEDVTALVDDVLAELEQLQAASDGAYGAVISQLRWSLTEFREAAFALSTTELETARPLLEERWQDVVTDYQVLTQRLDVVCPTD